MSGSIIPLILCGGAGTRLWPASREGRPKQFLRLFGETSTFQDVVRRVADPAVFGRPVIITNERYRFLVAEQLAQIGAQADILLEPARRDSGPAIVAGAVYAGQRGADAVVLALAADHRIADPAAFVEACLAARPAADSGHIVTFGVVPERAATEYGYIRPGAPLDAHAFAVARFVEKPDLATAKQYVADGYLWNSGNFMFRADVLRQDYARVDGDSVAAAAEAVENARTDLGFVKLDPDAFARARAVSIDYAVMEKTDRAAVVPVSFGWSDVGSWQAVWDLTAKDADENAMQGKALLLDTHESYVSTDRALVALLGVRDLVVVVSEDAVLVADRKRASDLKELVARVKSAAPETTEEHLKVHRPWGSYATIDRGERYQVKRIVVKPGGRLSLQMHNHRAEHWVVVRGTARVTVDDQVKTVHENESAYIPIGASHRLENPGRIDLELIEVQSGSYLGEDDIVRFDDDYHRS